MENFYETLLSLLGITAYRLEKDAKLSNGVIGQGIANNNFPAPKTLLKIKSAFPEKAELIEKAQKEWEAQQLAEMNISETSTLEESAPEYNRPSKDEKLKTARAALDITAGRSHDPKSTESVLVLLEPEGPLPESIPITEDVFAAGDSGFDDLHPQIIGYMQSPELKGCTRIVHQNGDSMEPVFSSGDMLGIEDLPVDSAIMSGYIYAFSYERYSVVKRLRKSKKGDAYIRICSENPNYEEEEILRKKIVRLAILRVKIPFSKIERFY